MKVINATITKKNSGGYFSKSFYSTNWQNELRNWVSKCVNKNDGWVLKLYQSTVVGPTFVGNAVPTRIIEI